MNYEYQKNGFTLAEVLITLIVIGVVSALTIPNILQNTQNAQHKAAFKRIYSDLEQATKKLAQDNGGTLAGTFSHNDSFRNLFSSYLSYIRICDDIDTSYGTDSNGDEYSNSKCWSKYNYLLNKSEGTTTYYNDSQVILNNGAFLNFNVIDSSCESDSVTSNDVCGEIGIDINGSKGPNQLGRDIFTLYVAKNRIIPAGTDSDNYVFGYCDPNSSGWNGTGFGCAALVLQNKDY